MLKASQAFPFRLAVCELSPRVQQKNLISPLRWQKLLKACVYAVSPFEDKVEVERNNWWYFVQYDDFFGFSPQLKIVERQMITLADVACDIKAIFGLT